MDQRAPHGRDPRRRVRAADRAATRPFVPVGRAAAGVPRDRASRPAMPERWPFKRTSRSRAPSYALWAMSITPRRVRGRARPRPVGHPRRDGLGRGSRAAARAPDPRGRHALPAGKPRRAPLGHRRAHRSAPAPSDGAAGHLRPLVPSACAARLAAALATGHPQGDPDVHRGTRVPQAFLFPEGRPAALPQRGNRHPRDLRAGPKVLHGRRH